MLRNVGILPRHYMVVTIQNATTGIFITVERSKFGTKMDSDKGRLSH